MPTVLILGPGHCSLTVLPEPCHGMSPKYRIRIFHATPFFYRNWASYWFHEREMPCDLLSGLGMVSGTCS